MADSPHSPARPDAPVRREPTAHEGSRIGAKALLRRDGKVLLIKEGRDDGSEFWTLPGGGVSPGESLRTGLQRELDEELQCSVRCGDPIGSCRYEHTSFGEVTTFYVVFECTLEGEPVPNAAEAVLESRWVDPAALPDALLNPFEELLEEFAAPGGG